MANRSNILKKVLVNLVAVLVYIPLDKYVLGNRFSGWTIIIPIVLMLPLTFLVKFRNRKKTRRSESL